MIHRRADLPKKQSFFLLGARQTGKSTLIHSICKKNVWQVNLLMTDVFFRYSKDPSIFRREAEEKIRNGAGIVFVDEIQKLPILLDEIQCLMDQYPCQWILTGSSARKLKRGGANLLGGRAVQRFLFPLTVEELKDQFDLEDALRFGTLPSLIGKTREEKKDILSAYANIYLKEEVQSEGFVRNLGVFSRFLDLAASQSGELVSYSAVAREAYTQVKTVQAYYQILEDTLLGIFLKPWNRSFRKRLVGHSKFYFFDLGVTNALNRRLQDSPDRMTLGRLFEQFIVLETYRLQQYSRSDSGLYFWRTNNGAEVDLLIEKGGKVVAAFEIKHTKNISGGDLSGLRSFRQDHPKADCFLIGLHENDYELDGVKIISWKKALDVYIKRYL